MAFTSFPVGGIMTPAGIYDDEVEEVKKFTSDDALQALLDKIQADPILVRQHIQIFQSQQNDLLRDTLWPAIFDKETWERSSTHRPTHDDEGEKLVYSDRVVRTFENEVWEENGKVLIGKVTTEHGSITDIQVEVRW